MTRITSALGPVRAAVGEKLRIAVPGKIEGGQPPIAYTQQWHVNGRVINGETGDSFVVRAQDDRKKITCITTATDAIGRVLILKPSNEIFIGERQRGSQGSRDCPPRQKVECPEAPPIQKRAKPAAAPQSKPKKPSTAQIQQEMRKAGGCRSCAERARARRRNQES